jgi:predicted DCC family thiol-disulfide oxidoreductase YuxK
MRKHVHPVLIKAEGKHLILFDASCPFCCNAVNKVMRWDKQNLFFYASLDSDLAKRMIEENPELRQIDSLILIEKYHAYNRRIWLSGRAVMRISWLIGGVFKTIGWMAFLPFGIDWAYRLIARHRHR